MVMISSTVYNSALTRGESPPARRSQVIGGATERIRALVARMGEINGEEEAEEQ